jgi:multicomponent Na+:H+ antiporter subunit C
VSVFPYLVVVWVLAVGLYGIVTSRHLIHLIMCLIVVQSSTYVLLLAVGYRRGRSRPTSPTFRCTLQPSIQWSRRWR